MLSRGARKHLIGWRDQFDHSQRLWHRNLFAEVLRTLDLPLLLLCNYFHVHTFLGIK